MYMPNPFDTPERKAFRDMITSFVQEHIARHAYDWDEAGGLPSDRHKIADMSAKIDAETALKMSTAKLK